MNNFDWCRQNRYQTKQDMYDYWLVNNETPLNSYKTDYSYQAFVNWLFEKHSKDKNKPKEHILDKQEKRYKFYGENPYACVWDENRFLFQLDKYID